MNDQQHYFDDAAHRYPNAVNPPLAQQLEMEHLERSLGKLSGKTILDFGAGSGRVTFWFLKRGYDVTAVDVSLKSLTDLKRMYKYKRTSSWGKLKTTTALPEKQFDAIVGADILHHIDLPTYLPRLYRMLKPFGRIAFSEPNAVHLLWYIHYLREGIPWHIEKGILQCTITNLVKLFRHTGFSKVDVKGHGIIPTKLLNKLPTFCRLNALSFGNIPVVRSIAFRFILSAQRKQ